MMHSSLVIDTIFAILHPELQINFEEADYSFREGSVNPLVIRVQFRETQIPFSLILSPLSIGQARELSSTDTDFRVSNFIDVNENIGAMATPGIVIETYSREYDGWKGEGST